MLQARAGQRDLEVTCWTVPANRGNRRTKDPNRSILHNARPGPYQGEHDLRVLGIVLVPGAKAGLVKRATASEEIVTTWKPRSAVARSPMLRWKSPVGSTPICTSLTQTS